jgi:hypothetical protein
VFLFQIFIIAPIWLWSSSVIKIVKMKYNRIDIKWWHVSTSFKIYLETLLHHVHDILLQHFTQGCIFFLFWNHERQDQRNSVTTALGAKQGLTMVHFLNKLIVSW